jgi:hypothetical protein
MRFLWAVKRFFEVGIVWMLGGTNPIGAPMNALLLISAILLLPCSKAHAFADPVQVFEFSSTGAAWDHSDAHGKAVFLIKAKGLTDQKNSQARVTLEQEGKALTGEVEVDVLDAPKSVFNAKAEVIFQEGHRKFLLLKVSDKDGKLVAELILKTDGMKRNPWE